VGLSFGFRAQMAIKEFGLKRVMILDWDVHHGNGTQSMFWDDGQVMSSSLPAHIYLWWRLHQFMGGGCLFLFLTLRLFSGP